MSRLKVDTSSMAAISRPAGSAFRKMDGDLGIKYQSEASKKGCIFWKFERKWNLQQPSVSVSYPVESHSSITIFNGSISMIVVDLIAKQVGCRVACDHSLPNISLAVPWKRVETPQFCSSMPHWILLRSRYNVPPLFAVLIAIYCYGVFLYAMILTDVQVSSSGLWNHLQAQIRRFLMCLACGWRGLHGALA